MLSGDADADIKILSAKFLLICNVGSPTRSSLFFTKTAPASESTNQNQPQKTRKPLCSALGSTATNFQVYPKI